MSEQPEEPSPPAAAAEPITQSWAATEAAAPAGEAPSPVPPPPSAAPAADRPEIPVAGAFAGGLVLALILKRLAR